MSLDKVHWLEWLFDGVGGGFLIALAGFAYKRWHSGKDPEQATIRTEPTISDNRRAEDRSVLVGSDANLRGSPIVVGSHNVVNIHHAEAVKPDEKKEDVGGDEEISVWAAVLIPLAILVVIGGSVYLLNRALAVTGTPETPAGKQHTSPETGDATHAVIGQTTIAHTSKIAHTNADRTTSADADETAYDGTGKISYGVVFQYGEGIASGAGTGYEYTDCTVGGITCLGETAITGKLISLPREGTANWSRIAVLVSFSEGGEMGRIVVSTTSDDVGLNYADHRDGTFHKQIDFQCEYPSAISEREKPYWYPVDIVYSEAGVNFPLTVTAAEDNHPAHSVTARFQIPALPSPAPKKPASTSEAVGSKPMNITIAERVTAIVAGRLYISRDKVKPDEDFEIDLGASPTQVTLIIDDLEEEYGISIPKSDALKIRTADEAIEYIERTEQMQK